MMKGKANSAMHLRVMAVHQTPGVPAGLQGFRVLGVWTYIGVYRFGFGI